MGAALGTTLVKLALRYISLVSDPVRQNRFCAEAMLIMTSVLHLGKSGLIHSSSNLHHQQLFFFHIITSIFLLQDFPQSR